MKNTEIIIRIPKALNDRIRIDLKRDHKYAFERIGFIYGKTKVLKNGTTIIFLNDYTPIPDNHYIKDFEVGAKINSDAIRNALQKAFDENKCCFHVHYHALDNKMPHFSRIDYIDNPEIVKSLSYISKDQIHGMLLIGTEGLNAEVKMPNNDSLVTVDKITIVGYPMNFNYPKLKNTNYSSVRYCRQSFLGSNSQFQISNVKVGIVGLGGGGSHIIQLLAHLGIQYYSIFDFDIVDESNLNRLIGATIQDVKDKKKKVNVAERLILGLQPDATINKVEDYWQKYPEFIHQSDIVIGAIDTFNGRRDLELECRRNLIPLIDIGMDIYDKYKNEPPSMAGQVLLSMPGAPCFTCLGFINDTNLAIEGKKYGDSGDKPQVVWSNGILASNAVGILVDLITGWSGNNDKNVYNSYDGNINSLTEHPRLIYSENICHHFKIKETGPSVFYKL